MKTIRPATCWPGSFLTPRLSMQTRPSTSRSPPPQPGRTPTAPREPGKRPRGHRRRTVRIRRRRHRRHLRMPSREVHGTKTTHTASVRNRPATDTPTSTSASPHPAGRRARLRKGTVGRPPAAGSARSGVAAGGAQLLPEGFPDDVGDRSAFLLSLLSKGLAELGSSHGSTEAAGTSGGRATAADVSSTSSPASALWRVRRSARRSSAGRSRSSRRSSSHRHSPGAADGIRTRQHGVDGQFGTVVRRWSGLRARRPLFQPRGRPSCRRPGPRSPSHGRGRSMPSSATPCRSGRVVDLHPSIVLRTPHVEDRPGSIVRKGCGDRG